MESQDSKTLRTVTVILAVLVLGFVMLTKADDYFGGTKMRRLFGMSADALAGRPVVVRSVYPPDAGGTQVPDAGDAAPPATP